MRCLICNRADVKEINIELLQRTGRRTGTVTAMAERLGIDRTTLWRHRKFHLRMYLSRKAPKLSELSFEERARLLAFEADRLQCMVENGLDKTQADQAMRSLALRVKLLSMESEFSGRPSKQKPPDAVLLEDPEEEARVMREFKEVVGESH